MPAEERPSRFRWYKKFIRTDAEQPCRTAHMTLSFLRANQWVIFEWKRTKDREQLYACMKKEVLPILASAEPELQVTQALGLERSSPSELASSREDIPPLPDERLKAEEPWSARRILIDQQGSPIAIGTPEELKPRITSSQEGVRSDYTVKETRIAAESPPDEPPQPKDYRIVKIFYATDHSRTGKGYSNQRETNDSLHLCAELLR